MPKISTDPGRHALNGPTMGTRWSALFHADAGLDPAPVPPQQGWRIVAPDAALIAAAW